MKDIEKIQKDKEKNIRKLVGFLIISLTLLTYSLIIVLMNFTYIISKPYYENIFYRIPMLVHVLCLISLFIGIYLAGSEKFGEYQRRNKKTQKRDD